MARAGASFHSHAAARSFCQCSVSGFSIIALLLGEWQNQDLKLFVVVPVPVKSVRRGVCEPPGTVYRVINCSAIQRASVLSVVQRVDQSKDHEATSTSVISLLYAVRRVSRSNGSDGSCRRKSDVRTASAGLVVVAVGPKSVDNTKQSVKVC
jgi:hypothetical protein